jgi:caffeoyl-CoA O-methyltransferase
MDIEYTKCDFVENGAESIMTNKSNPEHEHPVEQYTEQLYAVDDMLELVESGIRQEGMPEISIAPAYGRLLTMLIKMSGAKEALEIGALGGYSGICIARGLSEGGRLTSLEVEPRFADVARRHVDQAGLAERVHYVIGDAKESLKRLELSGAKFDFFFIDADKGGYPYYLDMAIKLSNPGAIIVGDNVLLRGRVADPSRESPSIHAMRAFNEQVATDPRLESAILTAYDGLAIARVKA